MAEEPLAMERPEKLLIFDKIRKTKDSKTP
jgi:hypothetical protein